MEPPVAPVHTDDWAIMTDTSFSNLDRLAAHRRMKSVLTSWDSSLVLMKQLGAERRDFELEAMFRQQRSEQFLIQNDGQVSADTAGADLRWLISNRELHNIDGLFHEAMGGLIPHYLAQAEIDSALAFIERTEERWADIDDYERSVLYNSAVDVYSTQGDFLNALFYLKRGVTDAKKRGGRGELYLLYGRMGDIMYTLGLMDQAVFAYSLSLLAHEQMPVEEQSEYGELTDVFAKQIVTADSEQSARNIYHKGVSWIGDETEQYLKISLNRSLAMFYAINLQYERALEPIAEGVALAQENRLPVAALALQTEQVKLMNKTGDHHGSIKLALSIKESLTEQQMRSNLLAIYKELIYAHNQLKQTERAGYYLRITDSLRQEIGATEQLAIDVVTLMNGYEREEQQLVYEQEGRIYQERLRRQKMLTYVTVGALVLALGLIYLAWIAFNYKRKSVDLLTARSQDLALTNKRLKQFANIVSHDILSRIDLLLSTGNLVLEETPRAEELEQYFVTSHRTGLQLKDYCLSLLRETRSGIRQSITSVVTVEQTISGVVEIYAADLSRLNFFVVREKMTAAAIPPVVIQQLLHNVLSNALKYVPVEGTTPILRITSEAAPTGHFYWVIEDNGPGIAHHQLTKVLTGHDLSTTSNGNGQGVGLSLLQAQLSMYGACIVLHKSELGGLRVVVTTLPKENSKTDVPSNEMHVA